MSNRSSFLPEDYVAQRAELRTNIISLILFAVVMLAVFLAFMVTNRKWTQVKEEQVAVNARYVETADQIETLQELQQQRSDLAHKAELAAALVDRVPRSILLAEIVNRMPDRLSLLQFELESEKIKTPIRRTGSGEVDQKTNRLAPSRRPTKAAAAEQEPDLLRVEAPRYSVSVTLTGVAPSNLEVSHFLGQLNTYPLFENVFLDYSQERDIAQQIMREFQISFDLIANADIRDIEPLRKDRRDPMAISDSGVTTIEP